MKIKLHFFSDERGVEKGDNSDIIKCWRKRKEFEVCGRLDENFKIVVCKVGERHHCDVHEMLSASERKKGVYNFHTHHTPVGEPSLGDRLAIYGYNEPEVIVGTEEAYLYSPADKNKAEKYSFEELQELEKEIYESFLDKFRDEEDAETLAYFATDVYFEREFPLTKQKVNVSI